MITSSLVADFLGDLGEQARRATGVDEPPEYLPSLPL